MGDGRRVAEFFLGRSTPAFTTSNRSTPGPINLNYGVQRGHTDDMTHISMQIPSGSDAPSSPGDNKVTQEPGPRQRGLIVYNRLASCKKILPYLKALAPNPLNPGTAPSPHGFVPNVSQGANVLILLVWLHTTRSHLHIPRHRFPDMSKHEIVLHIDWV